MAYIGKSPVTPTSSNDLEDVNSAGAADNNVLVYDSASGEFVAQALTASELPTTNVVAGTYGSASEVPVFTVTANGLLDSAGTVSVAGVSSTSYDSASGVFTINTADGGTFTTRFHDSDERIAEIRGAISAGGDLSYDANTGIFSFDVEQVYTKANFDSDLGAALAGGTGITYDSSSDTISITNTGVTAGTYGSASQVPVFTVNAQGQLDSAGTVSVAGVADFTYDSSTGQLVISTADGGTFASTVTLDPFSTTNLTEGTNLYYTTARADSDAKAAISVTDAGGDGSLAYNSGTGVITYTGPSASEVRAHLNVTDAGGDGSFTYDSASGKFTYTGPSASEVRAHFSGGTGVTITDGSIAIGQAVATTSDVTFAKIVGDSASLGQVNFKTAWADSHIPFEEGALWYDPHHKNLNFYTDFDHPIELGMQVIERVYNNTGSTISKGAPLYYSGNRTTDVGRECPTVALADATSASAYNVQGLAAADIPNNSYGQIVVAGVIDDFDTSGLTAGQNFFVGLTPGAVQNAAPSYPNYPMCLGWVVKSDATTGQVIINQQNHSVNTFRVQGATHIGDDLRVDGDLIVVGTQTITSTENIQIGGNIQYLNAGNTIGEAGTTFTGTGLDDAFFSGHYSGDSATKSFFVKIDSTGTPDTFEWGFDSSIGTEATGVAITGAAQMLDSTYGISIDFGATTGHTLNDMWTGTATAANVDTGFFSNRNAGSNYTHVGFFFDVSTNKWRLLDALDSEPSAPINLSSPTISYGDLVANQFEGAVVGNVTGNVTGTVSDISNHSTTNLSEGTNLYYTTARADSAFDDRLATKSTTNLSEGTNLYYTTARADSDAKNAVSAGTGISYNPATGVISSNDGQIVHDSLSGYVANEHIDHTGVTLTAGRGLTGGGDISSSRSFAIDSAEFAAYFSTSNLPEGTNLYYTTARADSDAKNALTGGNAITYDAATGTIAVTSNSIQADELDVSGNGTSGQALISDGDGSFSWGAAGATLSDDSSTNASRYILWDDVTSGSATSVGVSSTKLTFNPSSGQLFSTEVKTTALKDGSNRTLVIKDSDGTVLWGN